MLTAINRLHERHSPTLSIRSPAFAGKRQFLPRRRVCFLNLNPGQAWITQRPSEGLGVSTHMLEPMSPQGDDCDLTTLLKEEALHGRGCCGLSWSYLRAQLNTSPSVSRLRRAGHDGLQTHRQPETHQSSNSGKGRQQQNHMDSSWTSKQ